MNDYVIDPDGRVRIGNAIRGGAVQASPHDRDIAYFDDDGTVRDRMHGTEIGFIEADGTIKDRRNGREIGFVESDGTVRDRRYGQQVGKVGPPVHRNGALLLLLG